MLLGDEARSLLMLDGDWEVERIALVLHGQLLLLRLRTLVIARLLLRNDLPDLQVLICLAAPHPRNRRLWVNVALFIFPRVRLALGLLLNHT